MASILAISSRAKGSNSLQMDLSRSMKTTSDVVTNNKCCLVDQTPIIQELCQLYSSHLYERAATSCKVKVGKRYLRLYAFHFPIDSTTYEEKNPTSKILSFIEKDERQVLRKWTIKASLIVSFSKNVSDVIFVSI
jgi:hypothetical protein